MKIRIIENQEDTSINRGHSRGQLDILLTPLNGSTAEDVEAALNNKEYYGSYLVNIRDKMSVAKAVEDYFGPSIPAKRKPLEKLRGEPFPVKTKQAMDDFIKNLGGEKPGILTWEIKPNGTILFPSKNNESQLKTLNVLKQVLGAAGIKYKAEKFENLAEYSKSLQEIKRLKTLAGIKEIKIEKPGMIGFDKLEDGNNYEIEYYIRPEQKDTANITVLFHDGDLNEDGENWIVVKHIGGTDEDSFELYPEDLISARKL